jgi:hypothetical protein
MNFKMKKSKLLPLSMAVIFFLPFQWAAVAQAQTIQTEDIASETTPDSQLENTLRRNYPNAGAATYQYNRVDLNEDGESEVLAFLSSPAYCGSAGCSILLLQRSGQGYRILTEFHGYALPIVVSDQTTNGWHDLIAEDSDVLDQGSYYRWQFNGNVYVEENLPVNSTIFGRGFLLNGYSHEGIRLQ